MLKRDLGRSEEPPGASAGGTPGSARSETTCAVLAPTSKLSVACASNNSTSRNKQNIDFIISSSASAAADSPSKDESMASTTASTQRPGAPPTTEDLSTAASVLTSFSNAAPNVNAPVAYTPTTHRISKAKKGKKVHVCEYGCGKVFSRAEHRRRHEANHRSEPLYRCPEEGCEKTFQRPDLLNRHLERQHNYRPGTHTVRQELEAVASSASGAAEMRPVAHMSGPPPIPGNAGPLEALRGYPNSPTINDFDAYGDEIRDLYLRQKWPLKDIKGYMEDKHGFVPLGDHVYEQAFARLCLQQPADVAGAPDPDQMRPPELDPMLIANSSLQVQHSLGTHTGRPSEDNEAMNRLGRFDNGTKAGPNGGSTVSDSLAEGTKHLHDCPAPGCKQTGLEGFENKDQLWNHMVAMHNMG